MRRVLIILLLALLAGTLLSMAVSYDTGYIRINLGHYLVETNFWVGLILVLIFAIGLHLLLNLGRKVSHSSGNFTHWLTHVRVRRARRKTTRGLLELAEGNWPRAQKLLTASAPHTDTPLINYLAAAEAAHGQGKDKEAEELLRRAYDSTDGAEMAVGLSQAKLQLSSGQLEQALATLLRLRKKAPHHPFVLKQLKVVYTRLEAWKELSLLLPEMRKQGITTAEETQALEREVWLNLLKDAADQVRRQPAEERSTAPIDRVWDGLPTTMRKDSSVIHAYARHLAELDFDNRAETLLRKVLRNHWSDQLINLYGRVEGASVDEQLLAAENWLKKRPNNPELLLALGRISLRNELWGKAREYFETSLRLQRKPETLGELCRLTAHLGDHEQSIRLLKQGLLQDAGLPKLPMPHPRGLRGTRPLQKSADENPIPDALLKEK